MFDKICKTDSWHNTVTFVVLEPDVADRNWDIISEDEIINTAHEFMINLVDKKINIDHNDDEEIDQTDAQFVESFITPVSIPVDENNEIKKGSRLVAIKFSDELFKQIEDWEIVGISMQWEWRRE